MLSWSTHTFLLKPVGCGDERVSNVGEKHTKLQVGIFYFSIYLVALGNGGYQPNIATFGSDQFDEENPKESYSKVAFFSYFYLFLNLGQLFSNTFISYLQNEGFWILGFWLSAGSALLGLIIFLAGTPWYRYFPPLGNPISRVSQVVVAASRNSMVKLQPGGEGLYERDNDGVFSRRVLHTDGFRFFDRAAAPAVNSDEEEVDNPWRLCTVTQVEEVKCVLRLVPIWLCTILYSVIFTQMASLFVVQGAAMKLSVSNFRIPPSSMSVFDVLSVAFFIFINKRLVDPVVRRLHKDRSGMTELQRMGVGLVISISAMLAAGTVEHFRLKNAISTSTIPINDLNGSSLSIFWQVPQYVLVGASEVFMYVGQLEFFNSQIPDGLKSFGSALCMMSISLGNYVSSFLVTVVMKITGEGGKPGWIPENLNYGRLENFYFLLAILATVDFFVYVLCAKQYKKIRLEERYAGTGEADGDKNITI